MIKLNEGDRVKSIAKLLVFMMILLIPLSVSAGVKEDYEYSQKMRLAAAACLASYSNPNGQLITELAKREGWKIEKLEKVEDHADVQYMLLNNDQFAAGRHVYLLAVAGTETNQDLKVDLRVKKVYFDGATREEFAANAARQDVPPNAPRVHEGFNQVTQILLSVEVEQAQGKDAGQKKLLTTLLLENPDAKVFLTGHSLGGAAVTLLAARMVEMGVRPEQIEVVTFGAPTAGNEAFVKKYTGKFALTPVVVEGDPIPVALRRVYGGYRELGQKVVWNVPPALMVYSRHDMTVYLDLAIKKYMTALRQAEFAGVLPIAEPLQGQPRLYVAPILDSLPNELQGEWNFMRNVLLQRYEHVSPGFVLDPGAAFDNTTRNKALAAGCELMVVPEIKAAKFQNDFYTVTLQQKVYRVKDGELISEGTYSSNTLELTPMEAMIFQARAMDTESGAWLNPK